MSKRVLLLDYSEFEREKAIITLSGIDEFEFIEISNIEEFDKKLPFLENIDIIIMDVIFPTDIEGFEVLENLKLPEETKNIPVIILTNYSQKEDIDRCFTLGAKDYLIKAHFVPSEVVAKIKKLLS